MSTWIRRGVVALTALGTVVGSLALSAPSASAVEPTPSNVNATYYVGANTVNLGGSCEDPNYNTIAAALAAVATGDTIVVCSGTYQEGALTVPSGVTELTIKGEVAPPLADPSVFPAVGPQTGAPVLDGRDATTPANDALRVRILDAPSTFLHLENLTFQYGKAPAEQSVMVGGGGVRAKRVSLDHMAFDHNEASDGIDPGAGGAVLAVDPSPANTPAAPTMDIDASSFTNNTAAKRGGAVASRGYVVANNSSFDGNAAGNTTERSAWGGAIDGFLFEGDAPIVVTASSFTNNSLVTDPTWTQNGSLTGTAISGGAITITNSTVSKNTATGNYYFGPVYGTSNTIRFSTIVDNTAVIGSCQSCFGALFFLAQLTLGGSLVAGNTSACFASYTDEGSNLSDLTADCAPTGTSQTVADLAALKLGTLGEQGTSGTKSYPLQADSPAIDFADCDLGGVLTSALDIDQNGTVRPKGSGCEAGAVEYDPSSQPPAAPQGPGVYIKGKGTESCDDYTKISDAVAAAVTGDTIEICPGFYRETGQIEINIELTLEGLGETPYDVLIDGGDDHRVLFAGLAKLTIKNLTVQHGYVVDDGGAGIYALELDIQGAVVRLNSATQGSYGAGILTGLLTMTDTVVQSNGGPLVGAGVAVAGSGTHRIVRSTITGNGTAAGYGWVPTGGTPAKGGGVYVGAGSLEIEDSFFNSNEAQGDATEAQGGYGGSLAMDSAAGTLTITRSNFVSGIADFGSMIYTVAPATITDTSFRNGYTHLYGGAIYTTAHLRIDGSSFSGIYAVRFNTYPLPDFNDYVGTIYSTANAGSGDDVDISNSTFYSSYSFMDAAAIYALGNVRLEYVTVANNHTIGGVGPTPPRVIYAGGTLTAVNSLFVGNTVWSSWDPITLVGVDAGTLDCVADGGVTTDAHSASDENTCAPAVSGLSLSSSLGLFTWFGTSNTPTLELLWDSPAAGLADCSASILTVDQNDRTRDGDSDCDPGAFESVSYAGVQRVCPADGVTQRVGTDLDTGFPICQRVFSESGEFTVPNEVTSVDVVLVGGGGGGGGGGTNPASAIAGGALNAVLAGGGGAGGSVGLVQGVTVSPFAALSVTVGVGGTGGIAGTTDGTTRGTDGTDGGDSLFGTHSTAGGGGGRGAGYEGSSYYFGAGGSTPAGTGDVASSARAGGSAGAASWDTNYYLSSAGGGAGSGGVGITGVYSAPFGNAGLVLSGGGGKGFVPVLAGSLFEGPGWAFSAGGGTYGFGAGAGAGQSALGNSDVYPPQTPYGMLLDGSVEGGQGATVAAEVADGPLAGDIPQPTMPKGPPLVQGGPGAGAGGGVGYPGLTGDPNDPTTVNIWDGKTGANGAVIVRYIGGPLPECGETSGTATESDGVGYHEMLVTGQCRFVAPAGVNSIDVVSIGGGGPGGKGSSYANGGGGGGEVSLCPAVSTDGSDPIVVNPGQGGYVEDGYWGPSIYAGEDTSLTQGTSTLCGAGGGQPGGDGEFVFQDGAPTVRSASTVLFHRLVGGPRAADPAGFGAGDGGASGGLSGNDGGRGSLSYANFDTYSSAGGGGGGAGAPGSGSRLNKRTPITLSTPDDMSFSADGSQMFLTSYAAHNLRVFDTASETIVQTVDFGAGLYPWAAVQSGSKLYVSMNTGGVRVFDYDASSGTPLTSASTISVPGSNTGITAATDGRIFVAQNAQNKVAIIDPANANSVTYVSVGTGPWGVAAAGNYVFVSNNQGGTITVFDTNDSDALYTVDLGVGARPLNMAIYNGVLYVGGKTNAVWTIDAIDFSGFAVTGTLSATTLVTPLEAPVNAVAVSPDGLYLYAAMNSVDKVLMIDRSTGGLVETFNPAEMDNPWDVEANPATGVVYVSNESASTLSRFEPGCPQPSFVDWVNPVAPTSTVCYPSTGGAGATIGQLTGASSTLFNGDTRVYGGGGGGGSTNQFDGNQNALTLGGDGGGGTGGYDDGSGNAVAPTGGTDFGGGGGGVYNVPGGGCGDFCGRPVTRNGAVTTAAGNGAQGAVIIRWAAESNLKECAVTSDSEGYAGSFIGVLTDTIDGASVNYTDIGAPGAAVLTPDGTRAYVATSGGIAVVDAVTHTVITTIFTDASIPSLAISPDGKRLYAVSGGQGMVYVFDTDSNSAGTYNTLLDQVFVGDINIPVFGDVQGVVVSPDGNYVYVYDATSGKVVTIKTSDNSIDATRTPSLLTSGGRTYSGSMAISPDGTKLYLGFADSEDGLLVVVDMALFGAVKTIVLGLVGPKGLAVSADGTLVYATDNSTNEVNVVNPALLTGNVVRQISVSAGPSAIAITPSGNKLYVGHGGDYAKVTPIDISDPANPVVGTEIDTFANYVATGYCGGGGGDTGTGRVWIERDLGSGGVPVDTNGALDLTVSCDNPTYTSITAAVAAAQANDIIQVCSGTYREDEIVPTVDNLTIQGTEWVDPSTAPSPGPGRPASRHVGATLTDPVIIDGESTEADPTTRHRIFDATDLKITFKDVVLQNGSSDTYGGAVKAYQAVFVDSTVQDNRAPGGGAVFVSGQPTCDSPITRFLPGIQTCAPTAIFGPVSEPSVTVTNSEFLRNGVAELTNAPIRRGAAYSGGSIDGGAIYANAGAVSVTDSTFDANEALKTNDVPLTSDGAGGAIIADSVEVYGSTFTSNKALYHGGAIASSSVKVRASTTAGAPVATVFDSNDVAGDATWDGYGGAIWAAGVDVANASFVSNTADSGGAIASAVQQDQAPVVPSTVLTPATVTIEASTFEDNSATADGGAVLNKAVDGSTTVYNSTFSANDARNAGGAIYAQDALTVSFSTFDANTAGVSGGVFWTPVAPSVDDNIFSFAAADENEATRNGCLTYEWTPAKDVKNFTTNYWCPGTVVTSAELALSPLADNGGPTKTIALGATSVALDVADQTECDSRTNPTDERGNHRPVGKACDAGAYEYFGQVTLDTPPGTPGSFTSESGVKTLHILLVGGGGGGGAYGPNGEAGGGGGGGEVVECTINLTVNQTEVHYYFGLGGAEGEDGEDSKIWTTDESNPECFAAGGKAGVQGGDGTGAGAGGNAGGDAGLGGDAALCAAPATCTEGQTLAGGGGGGAGGNGADGSFDSYTSSAVGGSGGPGVSPSSVAFGDNAELYGGGGGGGAFCASDSSGGQGGTGGGGIGATGECVRRPVRGNPPSYGGGPVGGGGGGGAGTIPGGDGGSGTGEVRTPLPLGPDDIIHVCLNKLYVVYGARYFNPKVYYCVPVPDCSAPTSPTSNGSVSSLDPECCPSVTAPTSTGSVSSLDPECCPSGPVSPDDPNHCVVAPESAESSPTDGYATLSGDDVLASGLVGSLTEDLEADDRAPALATPAPLHYEHGIPDGYMKVNPEDYPDITPPTCTTDYVQGMGVADSPRDIDCTGGDPGDKMFDYSFLDGGLRIHPAELKVKPKHLRVAYGTSEPNPYEFTIKGFKLGETVEDISTLPTCDSDYTDSASAGSRFDITCSGGVADNYTFKYEKSHIHVDKRRVPLRPVDRTVTYGDPVPEFGFTLSGLFGPESSLAPERLAGFVAPLCSSAYTPVTSAGTVDIDCVGAASTNYEFVPVKGTITVRKASLRVLPKSMTVAYGAASPQVGFELSGFVNGETVPGSGYTAPKCSATGYTATTAAGSSLSVTCTGGSSRNYELDQTAQSTLLVTRATATITADAKTVAYGSAAPGFTYTVAGLRNGETPVSAGVSSANCSSSYTPSTDVGTVPVTCTGASSSNYDFTYVPSTITVTKATLRVTPDAKSVTYGQAMPALSWSVDGFANGQSPLSATGYSAPTCSTSATAVSNAGSYAITCSGGSAANYQFAYGTSQVTVNKAVLKATPANASVVYGSAAPTVGVTVTGFVNGQSSSTAAGFKAPTCTSVGYSMATNAGTYGITCAGGSATNYSFDNSASSVLTVTKATATVTAASKSVVYGTANPGWTFTLSGLKNSQTAATVAGLVAPTCVSTYTVTTAAGSVPAITCSGGSSTNYSFTYVAGKATVTKATLVVTPDAKSILKGSAIPAYTFTVAGYVNGQTASVLTAQPKCTSSYTTRSAVGSYTISCSGATAANYTVTYKTATLTVR